MITVTHLRKSYGTLLAVDDVSLEIEEGCTFGLLGPNGAGKTTTIHCMIGAQRPDTGRITVDGADDPTRTEVRRKVGIAPQRLAVYEELTGEENLRFFGGLYGVRGPRLRERVTWALEFAGLEDRRRGLVGKYSGGMQRRINMACALVHDPAVLFLDEPTVGVDPQSRNHIFDSIEQLARGGRTILYTTHYMEEAQRLCDKVAIMDRGRVLALGTVDGLIRTHGGRSVVTAELERLPADPGKLPGRLSGHHLRVETDEPERELAHLANAGLGLRTLTVERPDLEAVFLRLTGRSLRD